MLHYYRRYVVTTSLRTSATFLKMRTRIGEYFMELTCARTRISRTWMADAYTLHMYCCALKCAKSFVGASQFVEPLLSSTPPTDNENLRRRRVRDLVVTCLQKRRHGSRINQAFVFPVASRYFAIGRACCRMWSITFTALNFYFTTF